MSSLDSTGEAASRQALRFDRSSLAPYLLRVAGLAAAYYGAAKIGFVFEFAGPVAAIVWFPVGVGIACLYHGGLRLWPGVLIGDLLANDYTALPLGVAVGQTTGNVLEVAVATVVLRRLVRQGSPLDSVTGVASIAAAIAIGTAVSATIGVACLRMGDVLTSGLVTVWRTWWLGDASGALVVVPLALAWYPPPPRKLLARWREAVLLVVCIVVLSELAFRGERPLAYLAFPVLTWAALRFAQPGATAAIAVVVGLCVWSTTHYQGPFAYHSITHSVLSTQLFIAVASLSTLCLAAVVSEREAISRRLASSRARLSGAALAERRRIERNLHDGAQQRLVALAARLALAREQARRDPDEVCALFASAAAEVEVAIDELRVLAQGIHPAILTNLGLDEAVRSLLAGSSMRTSIVAMPVVRFDDATEATAYYVIAEAVANAQKHAHSSLLVVRASLVGRALVVEVADDGVGGAVETASSGLEGLRDRVEAAGGRFHLHSPPRRGTRVTARIPAGPRAPA
jgi:signal transduction histidine kinase